MPKNIVVFSDGTGQDGGVRPEQRVSNIYKMYRASRVSFDNDVDPAVQVTMYDAGLGTDLGATALTAPGRFVQKLLASVEGRGITTNIADCYTFILNHYQSGDRIFLFGFSRGAYKQRREIRKTIYDFPKKGDKRSHYAEWEGKNFNRLLSRFVIYARSANAIDETRADFDRVAWGPTVKGVSETAGFPTFQQFFFAGNHSDIGGSYAEVESRLSDIALAWMLEEVTKIPDGLKVGPVYVNGVKMAATGEHGPALTSIQPTTEYSTPKLPQRAIRSMP